MEETGSLFVESSAGSEYADVIVDLPSLRVEKPFTYEIPPELRGQVRVGSLVLVPLAGGLRTGFVARMRPEPGARDVKPIEDVLDAEPFFGPELAGLCEWIADYYLAPLSKVFRLVTPPGRGRKLQRIVELAVPPEEALRLLPHDGTERRIVELLVEKERSAGQLARQLAGDINPPLLKLRQAGVVAIHSRLSDPQIRRVSTSLVALTPAGAEELARPDGESALKRAPLQAAALRALAATGEMPLKRIKSETGAGRTVINALASKGLVEIRQAEAFRDPFAHLDCEPQSGPRLNPEQTMALGAITQPLDDGRFEAFLLHGITGSGKTEVYLHAIEHALRQGKSSITLVPEIALTPQMVSRFKARLGTQVAVLHSHLGIGERYDQWRRIARGDCRVVIGARSAIFAPTRDLGLIIIDEEHETSYKEHSPPRYHAREVALYRARTNNAVLLLGSATPSLESLYAAERGEFRLLNLPRRIDDRPLPRVSVVDLRESERGGRNLLSPAMVKALVDVYKSGDQAILFLNRRGFASFLQCHKCGYIFRCPACEVSLCFHLDRQVLLCHHCGLALTAPFICGDCGNSDFLYLGAGTERVEQELKRVLPPLRCIRMDSDTTRRKNAHWEMLDRFKAGEAHVLLGTQMIAKGLDIPSVTLVGIINADTSLGLPDFRAAERTFQLITQVSGRAGRGLRPGRVIIQTFNPEHYSIVPVAAGRQDSFYPQEMQFRRDAGYPPFSHLVNLVFSSPSEEAVREAAGEMERRLAGLLPGECRLLGPAPAPISRLKGRHRYHLIIKSPNLGLSATALREALPDFERWRAAYCSRRKLPPDALSLAVDVDPVSIL